MAADITGSLRRFQNGTYSFDDLRLLIEKYKQENNWPALRRVRIAAKRLQIAQVARSGQPIRIQVVATSDDEKDEFRKFAWGDYWLQYELIWFLGMRGFLVTRENPHVTWHLFGFPRALPPQTYNIAWCTSHPELLTPEVVFTYDQVYTLGDLHAQKLVQVGIDAEVMPAASSKTPYPAPERRYPAVFIGNTKPGQGMRPCVRMLKETGYPFLVWGWGWEEHLPPENIAGRYFDYTRINQLYATSACVLNDHHPAMQAMGMVSPKNFDVCAAGGLLVCERNPGIDPIFGDSVPQFSSVEELKNILFGLDQDPERREAMRQKAMRISLEYTYDKIIERISRHLREDCLVPMKAQ